MISFRRAAFALLASLSLTAVASAQDGGEVFFCGESSRGETYGIVVMWEGDPDSALSVGQGLCVAREGELAFAMLLQGHMSGVTPDGALPSLISFEGLGAEDAGWVFEGRFDRSDGELWVELSSADGSETDAQTQQAEAPLIPEFAVFLLPEIIEMADGAEVEYQALSVELRPEPRTLRCVGDYDHEGQSYRGFQIVDQGEVHSTLLMDETGTVVAVLTDEGDLLERVDEATFGERVCTEDEFMAKARGR
jgi:hypothetical protein